MNGFTASQTAAAYDAVLTDAKGTPIQERFFGEWLPVDTAGHGNVTDAVAAIVLRAVVAGKPARCVISGRPVAGAHVALKGQGMEAGFRGWTTTGFDVLSLDLSTREGIAEAARWVRDADALDALRTLWRQAPKA